MCHRISYFGKLFFLYAFFFCLQFTLAQTVDVMSRCGGTHSVALPPFTDADQDGLSDSLENMLLQHFVPAFIQFSDESCSGPASSGTSLMTDTNLAVCRIFPLFQQYTPGSDVSEIQAVPQSVVNEGCLTTGLTWYDNRIVIYGAVLYGRDCGLNGHIADVEGFSVLLKYTGDNDDVSWRYDTTLSNWQGITVQTVSHASTFCEVLETFPYKSTEHPNGKDSIFISPDKHGNYLTIPGCGSTFFCNPGCNNAPSPKSISIINVGEEAAPFVTDLGTYYSGYAGESPWSDTNFLDGGAGTIKAKLFPAWRSSFVSGQSIAGCNDICAIYDSCYNCGSTQYNACINACAGIPSGQTGCNNPVYDCTIGVAEQKLENFEIAVFPNPSKSQITVVMPVNAGKCIVVLKDAAGKVIKQDTYISQQISIETTDLTSGTYFLQITSGNTFYEKPVIIQ